MKPYARWARGVPYEHIRLLSFFELQRLVRHTPFRRGTIRLPAFSDGEQEGLSARERSLVHIYHKLKDWPLIRQVLLVVGPVLQLVCVREKRAGPSLPAAPRQSWVTGTSPPS
jgi:hypothetical protein